MNSGKRHQDSPNSRKKIDRQLAGESDANDFNDTAPYGNAKTKSSGADFNRNRDGLYGGLPDARKPGASGGRAKDPQPPPNKDKAKRA
jgi:hypothetical protein